ncbi:MAG TPA: YnbE family lipoprotein [Sphingomicrobium sp.]
MKPKLMLQLAGGAALMLPLAGCISVSPPDKPIEINLNVTIQQEVLVRLQRDVEQLIQQNPEAFPEQQPQQPRQQ